MHGEDADPTVGVMVTEVDEVLLLLLLLLLVLLLRWAANSSAEGLKGNRKLLLDNLMKFGRFVACSSSSLDDEGEYISGGTLLLMLMLLWRTLLSLGDANELRYLRRIHKLINLWLVVIIVSLTSAPLQPTHFGGARVGVSWTDLSRICRSPEERRGMEMRLQEQMKKESLQQLLEDTFHSQTVAGAVGAVVVVAG